LIFLIGKSRNDINQSEYLRCIRKIENSPVPHFELEEEYAMQQVVSELIANHLVASAHDVSEGGLWITLLESAFEKQLGFDITSDADVRLDAFLFGEAQSRVVVSVGEEQEDAFIDKLNTAKIPFSVLGHVTKGDVRVDDLSFGYITDLQNIYESAIEKQLNEK